MRFSAALREFGDQFRARYLDSDDVSDKTVMDADWTKQKVNCRSHMCLSVCLYKCKCCGELTASYRLDLQSYLLLVLLHM